MKLGTMRTQIKNPEKSNINTIELTIYTEFLENSEVFYCQLFGYFYQALKPSVYIHNISLYLHYFHRLHLNLFYYIYM
jgi:hypothetical protein